LLSLLPLKLNLRLPLVSPPEHIMRLILKQGFNDFLGLSKVLQCLLVVLLNVVNTRQGHVNLGDGRMHLAVVLLNDLERGVLQPHSLFVVAFDDVVVG
jgi:hypothetical protein